MDSWQGVIFLLRSWLYSWRPFTIKCSMLQNLYSSFRTEQRRNSPGDIGRALWGQEVDRTGSGLCPVGDFSVTSVKPPTSDSVVLVMISVKFQNMYYRYLYTQTSINIKVWISVWSSIVPPGNSVVIVFVQLVVFGLPLRNHCMLSLSFCTKT